MLSPFQIEFYAFLYVGVTFALSSMSVNRVLKRSHDWGKRLWLPDKRNSVSIAFISCSLNRCPSTVATMFSSFLICALLLLSSISGRAKSDNSSSVWLTDLCNSSTAFSKYVCLERRLSRSFAVSLMAVHRLWYWLFVCLIAASVSWENSEVIWWRSRFLPHSFNRSNRRSPSVWLLSNVLKGKQAKHRLQFWT